MIDSSGFRWAFYLNLSCMSRMSGVYMCTHDDDEHRWQKLNHPSTTMKIIVGYENDAYHIHRFDMIFFRDK